MDPSSKSKSAMDLALLKGFSDELSKIAGPFGVADATKMVKPNMQKPSYAKVNKGLTAPVNNSVVESAKITSPPPATGSNT